MTRWEVLGRTVLALLALAFLSGCGNDSDDAAGATTDDASQTAASPGTEPAAFRAAVAPALVTVDKAAGTVTVLARAARQGTQKVLAGRIEYLLVTTGGKEYETLFVTDASPAAVREALAGIGLSGGRPATTDLPPAGPCVAIDTEWTQDGHPVRQAADKLVRHVTTGKPLAEGWWRFTGSVRTVDPTTGAALWQADLTQAIVGLHYGDASPLLQNARSEARHENIYAASPDLPRETTAVRLVFRRVQPQVVPNTRRVHVRITGRLGEAAYDLYTQHQAAQRGVRGYVTLSPDGRAAELAAEGPAEAVETLLAELRRGPRAGRVETLDLTDAVPEAPENAFEVRP